MKILLLAKHVPDTYGKRELNLSSGMIDRDGVETVIDEIDERVAEVAAQVKAAHGDAEVVVATVGPADASKSLRKVLALSADRAIHVLDDALAGSDTVQIARVLAGLVDRENPDIVLAGSESTDGRGGVIPAMIAQLTKRSLLPNVDSVEVEGSAAQGVVNTPEAVTTLRAEFPTVVSLTEKAAEPRLPNFKAIREAKKKQVDTLSLADLDLQAGPDAAYVRSVMVSAEQRPPRTAGPKVEASDDAANQLVNFLAERHLI